MTKPVVVASYASPPPSMILAHPYSNNKYGHPWIATYSHRQAYPTIKEVLMRAISRPTNPSSIGLSSLALATFISCSFLYPIENVGAATPKRPSTKSMTVLKDDILFTAELTNGQSVDCLVRGGTVFAGKSLKKGSAFIPTATQLKGKISAIKQQIKDASGKKQKKKLKTKLNKTVSGITDRLIACGAEGGKGAGAPIAAECSLLPYRGAVGVNEVTTLLEKAAFGLGSQEAGLVSIGQNKGIEAVVDALMQVKQEDPVLTQTVLDWRDEILDNSDDIIRGGDREMRFEGMRSALIELYSQTANPYREKLGIFLLSVWTAAQDVLNEFGQTPLMWDYLELVRQYAYNPDVIALGQAVTIHPLMLKYLNGDQNSATSPNENYGRELMELFSLGPEDLNGNPNYTELGDIVQISKALTGWTVIPREIPNPSNPSETKTVWRAVQSPADHAPGQKILFAGKPYQQSIDDHEDAVRAVFNHPNASVYYAQQILKEYLTPKPPRCLVERFAKEIKASNFQLDKPMKKLLMSSAFYSPTFRNTVAKNSMEYVIGFIRTMGIPFSMWEVRNLLDGDLQMALTAAPDVFWWDPATWTSAPVTLGKANILTRLIRNKSEQLRDENTEADDWLPSQVCPTDPLATESQMIDMVMARMGVVVPDALRSQLLFYASNSRKNNGTYSPLRYDSREEYIQRRKCLGMYIIAALTPDYLHK
jgi:uncharacterized protein (DUF1800 family)